MIWFSGSSFIRRPFLICWAWFILYSPWHLGWSLISFQFVGLRTRRVFCLSRNVVREIKQFFSWCENIPHAPKEQEDIMKLVPIEGAKFPFISGAHLYGVLRSYWRKVLFWLAPAAHHPARFYLREPITISLLNWNILSTVSNCQCS